MGKVKTVSIDKVTFKVTENDEVYRFKFKDLIGSDYGIRADIGRFDIYVSDRACASYYDEDNPVITGLEVEIEED